MNWDERRRVLDDWVTSLTRPIGVGLGVYAGVVDKGRNPALIPLVFGLVGYKWVRDKKDGES